MSSDNFLSKLTNNVGKALESVSGSIGQAEVPIYRAPGDIYPGDTVDFIVNKYSNLEPFEVTAVNGTVNLVDLNNGRARLEYTAPLVAAGEELVDVLTVNGRKVDVKVLGEHIVTPEIVSIQDGEPGVSLQRYVTPSVFEHKPAANVHGQTEWQLSTDRYFNTIVSSGQYDVSLGEQDRTLGEIVDDVTYTKNTILYLRLRFIRGDGQLMSDWSNHVSFTVLPTALSGSEVAMLSTAEPDGLGSSMALSSDGTVALIGANRIDDNGTFSGGAYVYGYQDGSWQQVQKLIASDGLLSDQLGYSVSLSSDGTTALLGAVGVDGTYGATGAAYIFENQNGTWVEVQKLTASDAAESDQFGISVRLSGDGNTALIGSWSDEMGHDAGSAYIFEKQNGTWVEVQKLLASDGGDNNRFGHTADLSADGSIIIIGAQVNSNAYAEDGAAYIFEKQGGTWVETQKLTASDAAAYDHLGVSVAISDSGLTALLGANSADGAYMDSGAVYIFENQGGVWTEVQKLTASDVAASTYFGGSVTVSGGGTVALITAIPSSRELQPGSAYIFENQNGTWVEVQKVQASDASPRDRFGISIALSGNGLTAMASNSANVIYIFN